METNLKRFFTEECELERKEYNDTITKNATAEKTIRSGVQLPLNDLDRKQQTIKLIIEWGTDSKGERDWTIYPEPSDSCHIVAHSSGSFTASTIEGKAKECIEWFKGMLREDGYNLFEVIEVNKDGTER